MDDTEQRRLRQWAQAQCQVTVALLLEGIPDADVDWRYRVRIAEGQTSGWVEVEGRESPPNPQEVERLVSRLALELPAGQRVHRLEMNSPLVLDA